MPDTFTPPAMGSDSVVTFDAEEFDLIVVTQSCDLENRKAPHVAACPIYPIAEYEAQNPAYKGQWETVRRGQREGLHLLGALADPAQNAKSLVVDFRQIFSLPVGYLSTHASQQHPRYRLQSPYLEHFSQSFARFFMRVGLPSNIPRFRQ